jgi:hypothetical protein
MPVTYRDSNGRAYGVPDDVGFIIDPGHAAYMDVMDDPVAFCHDIAQNVGDIDDLGQIIGLVHGGKDNWPEIVKIVDRLTEQYAERYADEFRD